MSVRVDKLRDLQSGLAAPVRSEEEHKSVSGLAKNVSRVSRLAEKFGINEGAKRKVTFRRWIAEVAVEVDTRTGMDLDILPDTPWREYYDRGVSPGQAVVSALERAESEGEDECGLGLGESMQRPGLRNASLRKRGTTFEDVLGITEGVDVPKSDEERSTAISALSRLMDVLYNENVQDDYSQGSPVGLTTPVESSHGSLVEEEDDSLIARAARAVQADQAATAVLYEGGWTPSRTAEEGESADSSKSQGSHLRESEMSAIERAAAAIRADAGEIKAPAFASSSSGVSYGSGKVMGGGGLSEASVQGGDFGRWRPATAAVTRSGGMVASAITKKTGEKYTLIDKGMPQSADGGSELWFEIEPRDSTKPSYYLGVKIKGEKESPMWDVLLKKGKGLGSASGVASVKGVETSGLAGAVGSLKGKVG